MGVNYFELTLVCELIIGDYHIIKFNDVWIDVEQWLHCSTFNLLADWLNFSHRFVHEQRDLYLVLLHYFRHELHLKLGLHARSQRDDLGQVFGVLDLMGCHHLLILYAYWLFYPLIVGLTAFLRVPAIVAVGELYFFMGCNELDYVITFLLITFVAL